MTENANKPEQKLIWVDDLIARLQEIREKHGKIQVKIRLSGFETSMRIKSVSRVQTRQVSDETSIGFTREDAIITPDIDAQGLLSREKSVSTISKSFAEAKAMCWRLVKGYSEMVQYFKNQRQKSKAADKVISAIRKVHPTMLEIRDALVALEDFDQSMKKCIGAWMPSVAFPALDDLPIDPDMTDEEFAKRMTKFFNGKDTVVKLGGYVDLVKKIRAEKKARVDRIARLEERIAKETKGSAESQNAKVLRSKMEKIIDIMNCREKMVKERFKDQRRKMEDCIDEYAQAVFSQTELDEIKNPKYKY